MNASTARVSLLDGFRVSVDDVAAGTTVGGLPHGLQRLIAHLSLCGRPARGAIAGQLWPDVPEAHAHGSLRSALWRVQRAVPGLVEVSGSAVTLAAGVRVDVGEFVDWAHAVLDPAIRVDRIAAPAAALAGELLPGWYDDWVLLERERLRQLRMHALEVLADKLALAGRYGEAVQAAYAAVRDEPLRESAHRAIVRVHLAEGNVAEAMRAYRVFRDTLLRELGVPPTRQMEDLVSRAQLRPGAGGLVAGSAARLRPLAVPPAAVVPGA
ncbi:AfsR/SARP family transcriptional regulator [Geodermatophilus sabuli]|uniref:DNA-binding transcriptional activator of the SARP family n=1 Tax=Geodermatophilus sabuli TaxID=1564158 RepID=A0A285EF03_9ACTN|nr:BTAD domain-containing putative transcriptional regulator [Geodermatophilus sabuli]MBB3084070.1 DNA-binding SARP family transcriptional activator [Geodermatophilus sabuli]SNX96656.1 DNA-binding transcriptional activator of the SARP family [Geodermatophilus sabuli]